MLPCGSHGTVVRTDQQRQFFSQEEGTNYLLPYPAEKFFLFLPVSPVGRLVRSVEMEQNKIIRFRQPGCHTGFFRQVGVYIPCGVAWDKQIHLHRLCQPLHHIGAANSRPF